jgi:hypothetical protein
MVLSQLSWRILSQKENLRRGLLFAAWASSAQRRPKLNNEIMIKNKKVRLLLTFPPSKTFFWIKAVAGKKQHTAKLKKKQLPILKQTADRNDSDKYSLFFRFPVSSLSIPPAPLGKGGGEAGGIRFLA